MINVEGHEFTSTSKSVPNRPGLVTKDAGCSCGVKYEWTTREQQRDAHVLQEIRKEAWDQGATKASSWGGGYLRAILVTNPFRTDPLEVLTP